MDNLNKSGSRSTDSTRLATDILADLEFIRTTEELAGAEVSRMARNSAEISVSIGSTNGEAAGDIGDEAFMQDILDATILAEAFEEPAHVSPGASSDIQPKGDGDIIANPEYSNVVRYRGEIGELAGGAVSGKLGDIGSEDLERSFPDLATIDRAPSTKDDAPTLEAEVSRAEGSIGERDGPNSIPNSETLKEIVNSDSDSDSTKLPIGEGFALPSDGTHGKPTNGAIGSSTPSAFSVRGRFRRPHGSVQEEPTSELKLRFWAGVKPLSSQTRLFNPISKVEELNSQFTVSTVRAALILKKKAHVIQKKSMPTKYILDPRSPRMESWKNWMLMNIMFTVLVEPWRISFDTEAAAFGLTLNGIVNVSFIVDTVLKFFTAIVTETGLVTNRRVIVRRYLSSWFLLDAVTSLPFTTLLRNSVPASVRVLTSMRGLRLLHLLKVVKVYAMHYEVCENFYFPSWR